MPKSMAWLRVPFLRLFWMVVVVAVVSAWAFSGWPQIWWGPTIPPEAHSAPASDDGVGKIKGKFDASGLVGTYQMRGRSFQKIVKGDKAEKTEVRIGSEGATSFEPSFEFRKWDEVRFKLIPQMEAAAQPDEALDFTGDKIRYKGSKDEVHFYELPRSPSLPGGGYEIERILNEKPATNVLSFDIETENLEFFYQPVYTDAEIASEAFNDHFINPDAMGSYAVYYKNAPRNYVGGKRYGTGKVGQIYRPRIDDSAGNWTFGELKIDTAKKKLTVTIPQSFLDTATYPIYHASGLVFGYQTIGTAGTITIEASIKGSVFTMGTNSGAVDSITVYSNPSSTGRTFGTAIYVSSTNALVANSGSTAQTPSAAGAAWRTVTYATKPVVTGGTNYILAEWGTSGGGTHVIAYDAGTSGQGKTDANTSPFTWPDPLVPTNTTNKYSIYATYTAVPDAPTNVAATDGTFTDKVTITWTKSSGATDYHVWRDSTDLGSAGDVATFDDTGAAAPTITAGSAVASDGTSMDHVALSVSGASANNGTTHTYKVVASNAAGNSADSATNTGYRGVGALTYQWQRSAADSDASYSDISGATTAAYNDTGAPADGSGRYYKVVLNATGATQQVSASDRGYRLTVVISVTLTSDGAVAYGALVAGGTKSTLTLSDTQIAKNDGTVAEDFNIRGQNTACPWTLAGSAGTDQYVHEFSTNGGSGWTALTTSYQALVANIAANGTQNVDLRVTVPTSTNCYGQQSVDVTIQAVQH